MLDEYPCSGKVFAAGIIAEIEQIYRFKDHPQVAKYAGLNGKKRNLGQHHLKMLHLQNDAIVTFSIT